jgi:ubiquinone/menaquinone biosynthesis C-methylase UbiE
MHITVQELYGDIWGQDDPEFTAALNRSLQPRSSAVLYDLFGELGVGPDSLVLDVGCRDASYAVRLVQRFGCRAIGVDPIPLHGEWATKCISEVGLQARITIKIGSIEALPLEDNAIDLIWCRDMLNHVDLPRGLRECHRVLAPGGAMFIYMACATELCEPKEAQRIYRALAIVPENMSSDYFEATATQAGFQITGKQVIDSEWREAGLESGEDREGMIGDLLRISRMRRREAELVQRYGRARYEAAYAGDLWCLYILLGKLCPMVYTLSRTRR